MSLKNRLQKAIQTNNSILVSKKDFEDTNFKHGGFSTAELESYGFKKSDLKKLEHMGYAVRTYTPNFWKAGDTLPNGKTVPEKERFTGPGHKVRWLLLVPESL